MSVLTQRFGRILVLLLLGVAFGWLGPYGTYISLGLPTRIAYWTLAILLIGILARLVLGRLEEAQPSASWPPAIRGLVGSMIIGLPAAFIAVVLQTIFIEPPTISVVALAKIYMSATLVTAVITIPWVLFNARIGASHAGRATAKEPAPESKESGATVGGALSAAASSPSLFLRRIPAKLGTELLCIATEDHYLRVVTERGSDLILFRLSDAVNELKSLPGQQVHRSYWVAERAVATVEQSGNRTFLVLTNGTKVPVSQTFLPAIRQAGWLEKQSDSRRNELQPDPLGT